MTDLEVIINYILGALTVSIPLTFGALVAWGGVIKPNAAETGLKTLGGIVTVWYGTFFIALAALAFAKVVNQ